VPDLRDDRERRVFDLFHRLFSPFLALFRLFSIPVWSIRDRVAPSLFHPSRSRFISTVIIHEISSKLSSGRSARAQLRATCPDNDDTDNRTARLLLSPFKKLQTARRFSYRKYHRVVGNPVGAPFYKKDRNLQRGEVKDPRSRWYNDKGDTVSD